MRRLIVCNFPACWTLLWYHVLQKVTTMVGNLVGVCMVRNITKLVVALALTWSLVWQSFILPREIAYRNLAVNFVICIAQGWKNVLELKQLAEDNRPSWSFQGTRGVCRHLAKGFPTSRPGKSPRSGALLAAYGCFLKLIGKRHKHIMQAHMPIPFSFVFFQLLTLWSKKAFIVIKKGRKYFTNRISLESCSTKPQEISRPKQVTRLEKKNPIPFRMSNWRFKGSAFWPEEKSSKEPTSYNCFSRWRFGFFSFSSVSPFWF